jgi:hypothetical protein
MLKLPTHSGFHDLFLNSIMTFFIGYVNNTKIKLMIYFNSHMRIDEQITFAIPEFCFQYTGISKQGTPSFKQKCLIVDVNYMYLNE